MRKFHQTSPFARRGRPAARSPHIFCTTAARKWLSRPTSSVSAWSQRAWARPKLIWLRYHLPRLQTHQIRPNTLKLTKLNYSCQICTFGVIWARAVNLRSQSSANADFSVEWATLCIIWQCSCSQHIICHLLIGRLFTAFTDDMHYYILYKIKMES